MAWGSNTNPVAIGAATRKVDYDDLWDKLQYVKDSVVPAAGKMLQGASTAWVGWTKDTGTWTNNSMIVFTTGSISSGGSVAAQNAHSHGQNSHVHAVPYDGWSYTSTTASGRLLISSGGGTEVQATADQNSDPASPTTTADNTQPYYQLVIAATKDTYT